MNIDTVIYASGESFFEELGKKYVQHPKGLFIMTPSGAGKTYFCSRQEEQHWIDGDTVLTGSGAQPKNDWWNQGVPVIERVEQRCDVITQQCVDKGFWIMTSINSWLKPDAIVIPEWDILTAQIENRQENGYDGGLTSDQHEQLKKGIEIIQKWNTEHGVPLHKSIEEATRALTQQP
jgi:hypothetical protein